MHVGVIVEQDLLRARPARAPQRIYIRVRRPTLITGRPPLRALLAHPPTVRSAVARAARRIVVANRVLDADQVSLVAAGSRAFQDVAEKVGPGGQVLWIRRVIPGQVVALCAHRLAQAGLIGRKVRALAGSARVIGVWAKALELERQKDLEAGRVVDHIVGRVVDLIPGIRTGGNGLGLQRYRIEQSGAGFLPHHIQQVVFVEGNVRPRARVWVGA